MKFRRSSELTGLGSEPTGLEPAIIGNYWAYRAKREAYGRGVAIPRGGLDRAKVLICVNEFTARTPWTKYCSRLDDLERIKSKKEKHPESDKFRFLTLAEGYELDALDDIDKARGVTLLDRPVSEDYNRERALLKVLIGSGLLEAKQHPENSDAAVEIWQQIRASAADLRLNVDGADAGIPYQQHKVILNYLHPS